VAVADEAEKERIRSLSQSDIPIKERRALYNSMQRKMKSGIGLKPGLIQKYQAAASSRKERFALLKEFMIDENMSVAHFLTLNWKMNEQCV